MLCLLYNNSVSSLKGEPVFVLGPGWARSMAQVILVDVFVSIGIDSLENSSVVYHLLYLGMVAWNIVTCLLIMLNPGLAPRDPHIHTQTYLDEIAFRNLITMVCATCKIVERQVGAFRTTGYCRTVDHCQKCNVCIEG